MDYLNTVHFPLLSNLQPGASNAAMPNTASLREITCLDLPSLCWCARAALHCAGLQFHCSDMDLKTSAQLRLRQVLRTWT